MRVLVVEDEASLAASLRRGLEADGFAVDVALDGTDGLWRAQEVSYDAIVLDIMLPGVNGFEICRRLRADDIWTPILMLTAKDGALDESEALDTGADDYLTKPFSHIVLVAHLRALMRRGARERPAVLSAGELCVDPARGRFGKVEGHHGADRHPGHGDRHVAGKARLRSAVERHVPAGDQPATCRHAAGELRVDPASRRCWRADTEIRLTPRELSVLEFLVRRAGDVVSKRDILDHVWDDDFEGDPNIIEVYIRYLRKKIDLPFGRRAIETVRGSGYRLATDGG